jgi:hypothetical protein
MITLPYADDIRSIPVESTPQRKTRASNTVKISCFNHLVYSATEKQVDSMKTIISKLFIKGDYDPLVFENPSMLSINSHPKGH